MALVIKKYHTFLFQNFLLFLMKNKLKYFISITAFFSFVFSQISLDDINNINNAQLDLIKDQLKTPQEVSNIDTEVDIQTTSPDIVTIQANENELSNQLNNENELSNQLNNNQNNQNQNFESVDFEKNKFYDEYFGYDYFLRQVDFFDNASPSSDYVLGAGDEIVLSLWGEHNLQKNFLISKNGLIYYDSIGYINLSGKIVNLKKL